jgi:hypothetical protein
MIGAGRRALIALGLQEHETVMVAHDDRPHPHLHVITSTIHPDTGKSSRVSYSRKKLSVWAEEYEREHGKIFCGKRVENNAARAEEKPKHEKRESDLKATVARLYHASDGGEAFRAALAEHGLTLAQGKRIVVIDQNGKIHSVSRQIDDASAKEIRAKLGNLKLPNADDVRLTANPSEERKQPATAPKKRRRSAQNDPDHPLYPDRDKQNSDWEQSVIDAAIEAEKAKRTAPTSPTQPEPSPLRLNELQDRHLAEIGRLGTDSVLRRLKLEHDLDRDYGPHQRQLRAEEQRLDHVLKNSGWLRLSILKMTRQIPADPKRSLENTRMTLATIEQRQGEARQALEADIASRRHALEARHQAEKIDLRSRQNHASHQWTEPAPTSDGFEIDEDQGPSLSY